MTGGELERQLYALRDKADERTRKAGELSRALSGVTASAEVGQGAVRATVTASGRLSDLTLGADVRDWEPDRIAREVLACVQQAQARLADVTSTALADNAMADLAVDGLRGRFPPVAEPPPPTVEEDDGLVPELFDPPTPRDRRSWT